jgi:hypothetical protein
VEKPSHGDEGIIALCRLGGRKSNGIEEGVGGSGSSSALALSYALARLDSDSSLASEFQLRHPTPRSPLLDPHRSLFKSHLPLSTPPPALENSSDSVGWADLNCEVSLVLIRQ